MAYSIDVVRHNITIIDVLNPLQEHNMAEALKKDIAREILSLADDMAANACSLNNQTYEQFIGSRDNLEELLKRVFDTEKKQ